MNEDVFRGARFDRPGMDSVDRADCLFELVWPAREESVPLGAPDENLAPSGPLWVQELAAGGCRLVRGFRRFEALRRAGEQTFPALVFAPDCPVPELFRIRLAGRREELSPVEASRALTRIEAAGADESVLTDFLPLMGLPGTSTSLSSLRTLGGLAEPLARWCALQKTPLTECVALAALTRESQLGLLVLLRTLNPGGNLLRRWLSLLAGIAIRQGCPVEDVLFDSRICAVLLDSQTARSAGRELVSRRLSELRYPETTALRRRFADTVKNLGLPEGVKMDPPESFEGGAVRVSFEFGAPEELLRNAQALERAANASEAGELFRCLGAPRGETE